MSVSTVNETAINVGSNEQKHLVPQKNQVTCAQIARAALCSLTIGGGTGAVVTYAIINASGGAHPAAAYVAGAIVGSMFGLTGLLCVAVQ